MSILLPDWLFKLWCASPFGVGEACGFWASPTMYCFLAFCAACVAGAAAAGLEMAGFYARFKPTVGDRGCAYVVTAVLAFLYGLFWIVTVPLTLAVSPILVGVVARRVHSRVAAKREARRVRDDHMIKLVEERYGLPSQSDVV